MRKFTPLCVAILFSIIATVGNAQTLKFGHIDLQALIQVMPERETVETEFTKFQTDMEDILGEMQTDYQTKLGELEQMDENVSELKRDSKISELQNLSERIQGFQQNAQQQIQRKYQELLNPLYEKAQGAINEVAREQELMYVFETGSNVVLYKSNQSIDLFPLVKQKLGIE
ncbi:periplasmic chaperone for outer membrane proteins Skp [Tangfeifania diversioriginum]|uniref:Periplasmic chaperone for outer membrane proteins Skp n=1 Tax=Tangfeifania diversioriginum TaxID=1168035 RepID=A0A1M6HBN2_9BACT|nr:OmpH family outer membrane protein [Tangfeifania diversioriginum]SHJ19529.1 periplasmic chaperone for outer membrane proteins Skp [Tangfeifania diversioriginum]